MSSASESEEIREGAWNWIHAMQYVEEEEEEEEDGWIFLPLL
ncbi:hypothetical protein A2U01_0020629 [Trifolium medium]|uniref:Uncharacterized protein n=1 Tax=Trifolium medium TaxID=97028 RepID=A0A392NKJ4_9FABA|nr:hypothetical protein [Trifolium medium]